MIVGAHPVVAITVFDDSIDVAQLLVTGIGAASIVLVGTVSVGTHPYLAVTIFVDNTWCVVAEGRRVEFVVQELSVLPVAHVESKESIMVGGHPKQTMTVATEIPDKQSLGRVLESPCAQHARQCLVPALVPLHIDKGVAKVHHEDIAFGVNVDTILLIGNA